MSRGLDVDDAVRELLLLMPRMATRLKRTRVPASLEGAELGPRHLSLLAYLLFDGPMTVNDLAARLQIAPTTASLMVGELSRKGVLDRREDDHDRRRRIVSINAESRTAIDEWLSPGAAAWRKALAPLSADERRVFLDTLEAYQAALDAGDG